jgi:hypothetical protein
MRHTHTHTFTHVTISHSALFTRRGASTESYVLDATLCFVDDAAENEESSQADAKMSEEKKAQEETAEDGEQVGEQEGDATKADLWDSGVLGGYDCYVEGGDAAPEDGYDTMAKGGDGEDEDEEEGGPLIKCTPKSNSLCLALRDSGVLRCACVCEFS